MHRHFATFCNKITQFHQNAQKLTGNTNNGQILNNAIKYSVLQLVRELLKKHEYQRYFTAVMTEEKLAKK